LSSGSGPLFPVSRFPAGVGDRHDLKVSASPLPVNHEERKLPQQESAGMVGTACPALRSLRNLGKRALKFCIELEGCVRAALKIPIKRRVILGGGFLVKFHHPSGHEAASLNCDCELRTREWFLPCPNPAL
jgi:hypothetical protein